MTQDDLPRTAKDGDNSSFTVGGHLWPALSPTRLQSALSEMNRLIAPLSVDLPTSKVRIEELTVALGQVLDEGLLLLKAVAELKRRLDDFAHRNANTPHAGGINIVSSEDYLRILLSAKRAAERGEAISVDGSPKEDFDRAVDQLLAEFLSRQTPVK